MSQAQAQGLYRTYEELKPINLPAKILQIDICLYRTYEELKLPEVSFGCSDKTWFVSYL